MQWCSLYRGGHNVSAWSRLSPGSTWKWSTEETFPFPSALISSRDIILLLPLKIQKKRQCGSICLSDILMSEPINKMLFIVIKTCRHLWRVGFPFIYLNTTFQIRLPIFAALGAHPKQIHIVSFRTFPSLLWGPSHFEGLPLTILHHLWIMDQTAQRYQVCHKPPPNVNFSFLTSADSSPSSCWIPGDFCPVSFVSLLWVIGIKKGEKKSPSIGLINHHLR